MLRLDGVKFKQESTDENPAAQDQAVENKADTAWPPFQLTFSASAVNKSLENGFAKCRLSLHERSVCMEALSGPRSNKHFTNAIGDFAIAMVAKHHTEDKPLFLNPWWLLRRT